MIIQALGRKTTRRPHPIVGIFQGYDSMLPQVSFFFLDFPGQLVPKLHLTIVPSIHVNTIIESIFKHKLLVQFKYKYSNLGSAEGKLSDVLFLCEKKITKKTKTKHFLVSTKPVKMKRSQMHRFLINKKMKSA